MSALATAPRSLLPTVIDDLRESLFGTVTLPGDAGYDQARAVWNGMIDRYPAVIVHCATTSDVVTAVTFARRLDLPIAVRGGGHQVAGYGTVDHGLVIDLSPMKGIEVDAEKRIARVGGGCLWGEVDAATQVYGLATPGGVYSKTGVAGLTLSGGFGWMRNKHGLACDNLIAAEVVLASGEVVIAGTGPGEDPDLLWALRGGGGNFGVVTNFTFQLHDIGQELFVAVVFYPAEGQQVNDAVRFYRDFSLSAPDEVGSLFAVGKYPPGGKFPPELDGLPFSVILAVYVGDPAEGERVLQPIREFMTPVLDLSGVMPYVQAQQLVDEDFPTGKRYYWKSTNVVELTEEVIDIVSEHARNQVGFDSTTDLWHVGGAVARPNPGSSFNGRNVSMMVNLEANWYDPAEDQANIDWVRNCIADLEPFSDGSRYMNFAGYQEETTSLIEPAYGENWERLLELKKRYDPENAFRINHNISEPKPIDYWQR